MGLILDLPASLESAKTSNRVMAGSSLPPEIRAIVDREGYKKEYQAALLNDSQGKKKAATRADNGRSRTDAEQCIGMPIHSDLFMRRIIQLNSSLWFEEANADHEKMGIYLLVPVDMNYLEGKKFLFGFHKGIMPEFTLQRDPGEDGEGVGILRQGYRTLLMRLVRLRLISLAAVETLFGQPSNQSAYWAVLVGKRETID